MGEYNQDGKKNGQWIHFSNNTQFEKIDVFENFIEKDQIVYFGEYKNGQKQGDWKIKEGKKIIKGNSIIGGGVYDNQGLKDGSWIELWKFKLSNYIILKGFYKKGIKYGKWDIFLNKNKGLERIGGGSYDFEGMKHGKWINLHDNYNYNCQVFETGLYNHGIKQGKWDYKTINFYEHDVLTYPFWPKDSFYKIAGGNYEKGIKQGKWIELDENYHYQHQILYEGLYRNNIKQGEWEILDHHNSNLQKKGGGIYDEEGFKNFQWIELDKNNKKKLKLVEYSNGKIISEEILQNKI
ncbi:unnamed protein product [Paramecium sonneborni]|nr:unnamed protein product [Paramecium sonneborni]